MVQRLEKKNSPWTEMQRSRPKLVAHFDKIASSRPKLVATSSKKMHKQPLSQGGFWQAVMTPGLLLCMGLTHPRNVFRKKTTVCNFNKKMVFL